MWERIPGSDEPAISHRLKVRGGWIVRSVYTGYKEGAAIAQTFVADPDHEWKLGE